uniref:Transmembrane protein 42a n=1 Tax=Cyprinus carpio carpio TaxID=630221 RepID=A0A9J7ZY91_CYPCA
MRLMCVVNTEHTRTRRVKFAFMQPHQYASANDQSAHWELNFTFQRHHYNLFPQEALVGSESRILNGDIFISQSLKVWTDGQENTDGVNTTTCDWLHIPLRLLCGGLLFTCNAVMWTFFAKALRHSSSSARATVTTTASNFISSAFLGHVIFGETHAMLWWVGIILTLTGLLVLHGSTPQAPQENANKKYE